MRRFRLDGCLVGLLFLAGGLYFGLNVTRELNLAEEGTILYVGEQILSGQVLYRDINHHVTPGVFYVTALLMKLFGVSAVPTRYFMLLLFGASAALVYLLARCVAERPPALLAGVIFVFVERRYYEVIYYTPIALFLAGCALLLLFIYRKRGGDALPIAAGILSGLVLMTKQDFGAYSLATCLAALAIPAWLESEGCHPRGLGAFFRAAAWCVVGFLGTVGIILAYFAKAGAIRSMYRYCVLFILEGFAADYSLPWPNPFLGLPETLDIDQKVQWIHLQTGLYGSLALFAVAVALVVVARLRGRRGWNVAGYATVLLFAGLFFLGAFPRTDGYHVAIVLPPVMVLFAMTISLLGRGFATSGREEARELAVYALSAAAAFAVFVGARYAVRVDLRLRAQRNVPLAEAKAPMLLEPRKAAALTRLLGYLRSHLREGEQFFVLPYEPGLYYLLGSKNPTPYTMILPGNMNPDSEQEVIETLERRKLRFVVLIEQYYFDSLGFRKLWEYAPKLARYLRDHYRLAQDFDASPPANMGIVGERYTPTEKPYRVVRNLVDDFRNWSWGTLLPSGRRSLGLRSTSMMMDEIKGWWTASVRSWLFRRVVFLHPLPDSSKKRYADFRLTVPESGVLRFGISLFEDVWDKPGKGVWFQVAVREIGSDRYLFSKFLNPFSVPSHRRWLDYEADLSPYAGREIVLSLRTSSVLDTNVYAWAGFGEPTVVAYDRKDVLPARMNGKEVERVTADLLGNLDGAREFFEEEGREVPSPAALPPLALRPFGDAMCLFLHTAPKAAIWHIARFRIQVPSQSELRTTYGLASDVWNADRGEGARFRIRLTDASGQDQLLLDAEANPHRRTQDRRMFAFSSDLSAYAGETVMLDFETSPRVDTNEYGWAVFGDPRLSFTGVK